jgi:hypothetical protein
MDIKRVLDYIGILFFVLHNINYGKVGIWPCQSCRPRFIKRGSNCGGWEQNRVRIVQQVQAPTARTQEAKSTTLESQNVQDREI